MNFAPDILFNGCTGNAAPDWTQFQGLSLTGVCMNPDETGATHSTTGHSIELCDCLSVYAIRHDGEGELITDIDTSAFFMSGLEIAARALAIAATLSALSGLNCFIDPALSPDYGDILAKQAEALKPAPIHGVTEALKPD